MNRLLVAALFVGAVASLNAADTFGALSYEPPKGEARLSPHFLQYVETSGSSARLITVFRHLPSVGSASGDFQEEWKSRVKSMPAEIAPTGDPKTETTVLPGGWTRVQGGAENEAGNSTMALAVFSGHGVRASVRLAAYGDFGYRYQALEAFTALVDSIRPLSDVPQPVASLPRSAFLIRIPREFRQLGAWYERATFGTVDGRKTPMAVKFRLLDPIPVQRGTDPTAVLNSLARTNVPGNVSMPPIALRRFVGAGLAAWVQVGLAREAGEASATLYSMFLIDLSPLPVFQPLLVAQSYRVPAGADPKAYTTAGLDAFFGSVLEMEELLKGIECSGAKLGETVVDASILVGDYKFGKANGVRWDKVQGFEMLGVYPARRSGTLRLAANRSYRWREDGKAEETGRWTVEKDMLVLTPNNGEARMLRIAAHSTFTDGVLLILVEEHYVVNALSVRNADDCFVAPLRR